MNSSHVEGKDERERDVPVVHVKLMKDVPGQKMVKRGSTLKIPLGKSLIMGPYKTRGMILLFRVIGSGVQIVVVMCEIPKNLVGATYRTNGDIVV